MKAVPVALRRPTTQSTLPAVAPTLGAIVARAGLAAFALAALMVIGPPLGAVWSWWISTTLFVGIVAVTALPAQAYLLSGLCGVAVLVQWTSLRTSVYQLLLIGGTYLLRRRPALLISFLVFGVVVIPKELFRRYYHQAFLHDWVNPFLLVHLCLIVLTWWSTQRRGRANEPGFGAWLALLLFPSHPINAMKFTPGDLWRPRVAAARDVLTSLLIVAAKAAALWAIGWVWPRGTLAQQDAAGLRDGSLSLVALWRGVGLSYLVCALALSGTADVSVVIARLFGWRLLHSFRWALLAWNPVELWRRWAIYNRKVLLALVYFPLGGGDRHRSLNVMLTFGASGLLLHSGWLGSRYWEASAAGWRDQTLYFLLQGLAVCGCLWFWRWRGKSADLDRELRWSWGRVAGAVATQALSAWLHILILTPQLDLLDRCRLMARCVGLGGWLR
jgi:hypothetical protein